VRSLSIAADLYRADLCRSPGIISGYPWFEIWGRDTLIALHGLYFVTGRTEQAKSIVSSLLQRMKAGRLPNRLPDDGKPAEYNTADASLLLFGVSRQFATLLPTNDPFPRDVLLPALREVFDAHMAGTDNNIYVTSTGLLAAGEAGSSLTWMDARVRGEPVTSRWGHAIELQALWSKGCDDLAWIATKLGDSATASKAIAARDTARRSFMRRFWCFATNYPYDVLSISEDPQDAWCDASVRPNAIIALAVDPDLFTHDQAMQIIDKAERELLTDAGLRSLSLWDPSYRGTYAGTIEERDRAYHQGTAWPFLLGAFAHATMATYPNDNRRRNNLRKLLEGSLSNQLALGQIPELANGNAPYRPDGCIAFASSVAEILRALVNELGE
jgi:predicted glycogen debranching enzyme